MAIDKLTKFYRSEDVQKQWFVIDAEGVVLGRLAVFIANKLIGKDKPTYTPHIDCSDHIVVINAEKIRLKGKKLSQKKYFYHTGFPGGIREIYASNILAGKNPQRVLQKAVRRMISKGKLGETRLKNLHVYAGVTHPHIAQQPKSIDFISMNKKNQ